MKKLIIDNLKTLLRNRYENSKNILESVVFAPESFNQEATVEKAKKLNEYKSLKSDLKIKTSHLTTFQNKNDLDRPANYPLSDTRTIGVILLILGLEIILNGLTFAEYVQKGLLGGIVLAIVIAGVNIFFVASQAGGAFRPQPPSRFPKFVTENPPSATHFLS